MKTSNAAGGYAEADLQPTGNSQAMGTARLVKKSGQYSLKVSVSGLAPTKRGQQYALWQLRSPRDLKALDAARHMVEIATYRVGNDGRLYEEFLPTPRSPLGVTEGTLTYFFITRIESPARLQKSIVEFDETGRAPELGEPILQGKFKGPLVGAG